MCLIVPELQAKFRGINQVSDFAEKQLNMSLVTSWPDVDVMVQNNIPVIESIDYQSAVKKIRTQQAQCFSRSVIEVGAELEMLPALAEEQHIALIYPFADIIYVNPNNPELHKALTMGLSLALEDRSFYQLHYRHYSQRLFEHRFYVRKLIIMENENLSEAAHQAINRYGIASFNRLRRQR